MTRAPFAAPPSSAAVAGDAAWLAHRYDPGHDAVHFRAVPREQRASVPFLTDLHLGEEASPVVLRRDDCRTAAQAVRAPIHFLFHSAYCASTMLAQALDQQGQVGGLVMHGHDDRELGPAGGTRRTLNRLGPDIRHERPFNCGSLRR